MILFTETCYRLKKKHTPFYNYYNTEVRPNHLNKCYTYASIRQITFDLFKIPEPWFIGYDKSGFGVLVWRKHVHYSFIRKKNSTLFADIAVPQDPCILCIVQINTNFQETRFNNGITNLHHWFLSKLHKPTSCRSRWFCESRCVFYSCTFSPTMVSNKIIVHTA